MNPAIIPKRVANWNLVFAGTPRLFLRSNNVKLTFYFWFIARSFRHFVAKVVFHGDDIYNRQIFR